MKLVFTLVLVAITVAIFIVLRLFENDITPQNVIKDK